MKKCKLLITDLDGTLIETVSGDTFPKGIWDMKIKLDVFEAIKNYAPDDILIISNQGGIEKGFVDREMFEYKFDYISNALEDYTDISVSAYYCDSNNKRNANRKPNTGMIKQYMDFVEYMNDDEDEEEKIVYDTILMIGDASGKVDWDKHLNIVYYTIIISSHHSYRKSISKNVINNSFVKSV